MTLNFENNNTNEYMPLGIRTEDIFSGEGCQYFRLILVEDGRGVVKVNDRSLVFMSPCVLCFNDMDSIHLVNNCGIKARMVYFEPRVINSVLTTETIRSVGEELSNTNYQDYFYLIPFLDRDDKYNGMIEIGVGESKRMIQLLEMLKREITTPDNKFWPCRTRSFFLEILFLLQYIYTEYEKKDTVLLPGVSGEYSGIVLYLHSNYSRKITINELTDKFHVNRTTLSETFRRETGITLIEYLIRLRIKMASIMLRDTLLPVSEIIIRAGFNDSAHFNRMFKKYTGLSPSQYRRRFNL